MSWVYNDILPTSTASPRLQEMHTDQYGEHISDTDMVEI